MVGALGNRAGSVLRRYFDVKGVDISDRVISEVIFEQGPKQ